MNEIGEALRNVMRCWTTGVVVVTSRMGAENHGMTVNSFTSVSLEPPMVTMTMKRGTRSHMLVEKSGIFAVTILAASQETLANRFSGRLDEGDGRFKGLKTFTMVSGAPLLEGGLAFLDCQVEHTHPLPDSTLFIGKVLAAQSSGTCDPLVYLNRTFHRVQP